MEGAWIPFNSLLREDEMKPEQREVEAMGIAAGRQASGRRALREAAGGGMAGALGP